MKITRKNSFLARSRRRLGFTMVESMVLVGILGVTAGVVGQSLTTMSNSAVQNNLILEINDQLLSQMEYLRSNYQNLTPAPTASTPWTSSGSVTMADGQTFTMTSKVAWADPGLGSAQSNFLSLQVTINNQTMSTYVSE